MLQASTRDGYHAGVFPKRGQNGVRTCRLQLRPEPTQDGAEVIPIVTPTVVAFIGRTERGPLNEPVVVKGFDEFSRVFGGHTSRSASCRWPCNISFGTAAR